MKYSTRLSDAVHIALFIYLNPNDDLSSAAIAASIQTHPSYVRQLMSSMKKAGLIACSRGLANPSLCRPLKAITLFDMYKAIEGDKPLLHQDTHTNPDCGVGVNIQLALRDCYHAVQQKAEDEMKRITLQTVADLYEQKTSGSL